MWLAISKLCYLYRGGLEEGRNTLLFLCIWWGLIVKKLNTWVWHTTTTFVVPSRTLVAILLQYVTLVVLMVALVLLTEVAETGKTAACHELGVM